MIGVLSNPKEEITIADIQDLIDSEVPEGEQIEFKRELQARGNGSPDPWMSDQSSIGDRAKNQILEEAVAFANAHGGALLLGIKESESAPPVAAELLPIPRCAELAERLKLIFRDCVEPQLPVIDVFAVPKDGDSGVIVIRVGRSRNAPHRVTKTLVCPIRRADRCEEMSMREIQDMTINVSRGLERLDRRLTERSERFQEEFKRLNTPNDAFGFRMTAAPVGDEIQLNRVFEQGRILNEFNVLWHTVTRQINDREQVFNHPHELPPNYWRPILRGARAELDYDHALTGHTLNSYKELHCDGLLELGFVSCRSLFDRPCIPPDWPIVLFLNLAIWTQHIRIQADAPRSEYALEVEIFVKGTHIPVMNPHAMRPPSCTLQSGATRFPRYPLSDGDEILELLTLFERDFWNSLGQDVGPEENNLIIKAVPGAI